MKRKKTCRLFIGFLGVLFLLSFIASIGFAEIPKTIHYQGYLTNMDGTPIDGQKEVTFRIYDNETALPANARWTEIQTVSINNGVYNAVLGSVDPVDNPMNLPFDVQCWLGVQVAGDPDEMTPRIELTSVPYAFRAGQAESAVNVVDGGVINTMIADDAITTEKIVDNSVSSADVDFNYAGSTSKGGPAVDLECLGCVSQSELDFTSGDDGDWTIVGNDLHLAVSGNVGIGTMSPEYNLHVVGFLNYHQLSVGGSNSPGINMYTTSADPNARNWGLTTNAYNAGGFYIMNSNNNSGNPYNGNSRFTIDKNGFVGIGLINPAYKLDVNGAINAPSIKVNGVNVLTAYTETDPVFALSPASGVTSGDITNWNSSYGWGDHSSEAYDTTNDSWTGTGNVYTTSGNVGIGKTNPTEKLDIIGNVKIVGTGDPLVVRASTNGEGVKIREVDDGYVAIGLMGYSTRGSLFLNNNGTRTIHLDAEPSLNSYINAGKVGIGTTSPGEKLTVAGTIESTSGGFKFPDGTTQTSAGGTGDGHSLDDVNGNTIDAVFVDNGGSVGIGTINPHARLHIAGNNNALILEGIAAPNNHEGRLSFGDDLFVSLQEDQDNALEIYAEERIALMGGNVGIGTYTPGSHKLYVTSEVGGVSATTAFIENTNTVDGNGIALKLGNNSPDTTMVIVNRDETGDLIRGDYYDSGDVWHRTFKVSATGIITGSVLEITGGADIAEPFDISNPETVKAGMVMSIDPERSGQLRVASNAYDQTVAGIVSGAGDINAGMVMGQQGTMADGTHPIALTGRVYALADASYGSITPGDLLTTSNTPGHAMKAVDRDRTYGTVIGKAMTGLEKGKGLVLVLVNLQ